MQPAARIQAAIEILRELSETSRPVDRSMAAYFRVRRYAGGKDRAAISQRVYDVLRRRGELMWRCGEDAGPRLQVLASLVLDGSLSAADMAQLCDGERHAPVPLDATERARLDGLSEDRGAIPDWVTGNYPAWLDDALTQSFGAAKLDEMRAMNLRAPVDLRVNSLKTTADKVLRALDEDGIAAAPGALARDCLRLDEPHDLSRHKQFTSGRIEIQDQGSQLIALMCQAQPGEQIVDFCAGAGGKTLALAAAMAGRGQVYALDTDARRLGRLKQRLDRAGARNVQLHALTGDADPWLDGLAGTAHRVLVDAPCSGSGAWRRQPDTRWRLTPEMLEGYAEAQGAILRRAAALVRPAGRLVYATCSILAAENQQQAERFLAESADFSLLPAHEVWAQALGDPPDFARDYLHLTPARSGTDGFFVAVFERGA
jgi:16S rRNA (cytosine967-C5)-methyltransferase